MTASIISTPGASGNLLLNAALAYARRGWTVIPTAAKRARGAWKKYQTVKPDTTELRQLFSKGHISGVAVVLGSASNSLCCRDYDDLASYNRWAESQPSLARTLPTVETHRGRHLYFRGPEGFAKFNDGEYRGTPGQYTVLPPSRHPAGTNYRWHVPLPDGELPYVDPFHVGLCNRENRANTEDREDTANRPSPLLSSLSSAPSLLQAVENAIGATLPTMQGERRLCIFRLARHLKSIPSLHSAHPGTLRPIVEQWHRRALPIIGTKPFLDTWADFLQAWKRVRFPAGESPIGAAFKRALASTPPSTAVKLYGEGPIVLLAAVCWELQRIVGAGDFFLDCRTAGRLIGVDHATAWRYLEVLCADGVLAPGAKGSKATRKASRFRFMDLDQGGKRQ